MDSNEQKSTSRIRKLYIGGAIASVIILLTANLAFIIAADPPSGFATVIEPGSLVTDADYYIYLDEGNCYAKNGQTGETEYSGADHSEVIQDALSALPSSGGRVVICEGTYVLPETVYIHTNNTEVTGVGMRTVLYLDDNVNSPAIQAGYGTNKAKGDTQLLGIWVRNLKVDGNAAGNTVYDGTDAPYCIYFNNVKYGGIQGCYVEDSGTDGIIVSYGCEELVLSENHAVSASSGITIDRWSYRIAVVGNTLKSSGAVGVTMYEAYDCVISGNVVEEIAGSGCYRITITGNTIITTPTVGDYGVNLVSNNENIVITGNSFFGINLDAIRLYAIAPDLTPGEIRNVVISGNDIDGNGTTQRGIHTTRMYGNVTISNNNFMDLTVNAIDIGDSGAVIEGNSIYKTGQAGIVVGGNYSVVTNNQLLRTSRFNHNVYSAILLNENCSQSIVSNNVIATPDGALIYPKYGIEEADSADYNLITDNIISDYATAGVYSATNTIVSGNIGHATENSGSQTITGAVNTVDVTHGLVSTPTVVVVTGNNTGIGDYWVTATTSTTFTVSFENQPGASTWTFYWYATV